MVGFLQFGSGLDTGQVVGDLVAKYASFGRGIAELVVVTAVLYGLGRLVVEPAGRWVIERRGVDRTIAVALRRGLRAAVVVGAVAGGAGAAGFTAVLGGSALLAAAATLAVGFAARDVIGNFVSGLFIVQDRNFNIDDWIEWDDRTGVIEDIGLRVTRVRTFDNEVITVPNADLATKPVTNRLIRERYRATAEFGVGYGDDLGEATRLLLEVAADEDEVLADPEPSVRVTRLEDASIVLTARVWVRAVERPQVSRIRSRYVRAATERFAAEGIDLSTTTRHDLSGELAVEDPPA